MSFYQEKMWSKQSRTRTEFIGIICFFNFKSQSWQTPILREFNSIKLHKTPPLFTHVYPLCKSQSPDLSRIQHPHPSGPRARQGWRLRSMPAGLQEANHDFSRDPQWNWHVSRKNPKRILPEFLEIKMYVNRLIMNMRGYMAISHMRGINGFWAKGHNS